MTSVQHNFARSRYDIYFGGQPAGFLQYEMRHGRMCFLLTELAPRIRNRKSVESILGGIFDDLHHRRMEVLPYCPVVRNFLAARPVYSRMVPSDKVRRFGLVPAGSLMGPTTAARPVTQPAAAR